MALSYNFIQISNKGRLALSERPKIKEIKSLLNTECDVVVTILGEKGEQASIIGHEVEQCGMIWEWVKIQNTSSISDRERLYFKSAVLKVSEFINEDKSVLIHCSAGLHRTGIFAYCVLHQLKFSHDEILNLIKEIRN